MTARSVTVVTGTRAEYGLLRSSMEHIVGRDDLALTTIATGMHLTPQHGMTVQDIEDDGFHVSRRIHTEMVDDSGLGMAKGLGAAISGMADAFGDLDPDVVLVLGDRGEAFAAAVAAAHMNVPVAHVHGGDAMEGATIDDSIRHALTKFAHLHFPASAQSRDRLLGLGEAEWRITLVGSPALDAIRNGEYSDPASIREAFAVDPEDPLVVVVQHPVTTAPSKAGEQLATTLDAVTDHPEEPTVVVGYPNTDAGSARMVDVLERFERSADVRTFRSVPRPEYLGLLATADVLVGNSSSGIIEAPSFGLPVVDVGSRQAHRQRAANTVEVPHDVDAIRDAVGAILSGDANVDRDGPYENPYDYGETGESIAARLATVDLDEALLQKELTI